MYRLIYIITIVSIILGVNACGNKTDENKIELVQEENKTCSKDDAVALYYKQENFIDKFRELSKKWHSTEEKNKIEIVIKNFTDEFNEKVKININKKDNLACENYNKLKNEYNKKFLQLTKINKNRDDNISAPKNSEVDDEFTNKKYNYIVDLINNFTPNISNSFNKYAIACGKDKNKRTRPMVDYAMRIVNDSISEFPPAIQKKMKANNAEKYAMYDQSYGYHLVVYYSESKKAHALKIIDESLSIDRMNYTNDTIKEYKKHILKFMKLYSEAFEYYDMQDYTEDNYKKANELHTPLVLAYEKVMESDASLRAIIEKIEEKQILKRIKMYKENNQMIRFYVEKSIYLSKKFLSLAKKDEYIKLDFMEIQVLHKKLRKHYSEFKSYKEKNTILFKENSEYSEYLQEYREYVTISKKFYIRVKEKRPYDFGEKILENGSGQNMIEGSISKLFSQYNKLVNKYNSLNK